MKLTITDCLSTQSAGDDIEFDVIDERSEQHTLRIRKAVFREMVIDAMLTHALTKESLGLALQSAAPYVSRGPKR